MHDRLDRVIGAWTRIGAGFGAEPAGETPDLERLLLDTARESAGMSRLFIMAATWLHRYGDLVAKRRLKRLVREELEAEYQPVLGLLLDVAQRGSYPREFQAVIRGLGPTKAPRALFDIQWTNVRLRARAERRASAISKRWGLWCEELDFKEDALRPARWVMEQNPGFVTRTDLKGDLRASVLAALEHDKGAGKSEMSLARSAGGSRAQVRNALVNLELSGRIERLRDNDRRTRVELGRVA